MFTAKIAVSSYDIPYALFYELVAYDYHHITHFRQDVILDKIVSNDLVIWEFTVTEQSRICSIPILDWAYREHQSVRGVELRREDGTIVFHRGFFAAIHKEGV